MRMETIKITITFYRLNEFVKENNDLDSRLVSSEMHKNLVRLI